jgi:hypothetical protein
MLPAPTEMQRLVNIFFENTGHIFPYIRETTVLGYIASLLKSDPITQEPVEYCILYMCMAFATLQGQLGLPSEDDLASSYDYFQRAQTMVSRILGYISRIESSISLRPKGHIFHADSG